MAALPPRAYEAPLSTVQGFHPPPPVPPPLHLRPHRHPHISLRMNADQRRRWRRRMARTGHVVAAFCPTFRRTRPPSSSTQGPTRPHNRRRLATTGHVDTDMPPPHRSLAPACAASPCSSQARCTSLGLRHRVRHVAVHLPLAYSLIVRSLSFFFLLTSSFSVSCRAVPLGTMGMWPQGREQVRRWPRSRCG